MEPQVDARDHRWPDGVCVHWITVRAKVIARTMRY